MAGQNPLQTILWCLDHCPGAVHILDLAGLVKRARVRKVAVEAPGFKAAKIERGLIVAEVPAMVARSLQQPPEEQDLLLVIHIRREVVERAESPVLIPPGVIVQ